MAPNFVVFDKEGKPSGVRYDMVNAMLLNEVQKQRRMIEAQQHENDALRKQLATQQQQIERVNAALETQHASEQFQIRVLETELTAMREALQHRDPSLVRVRTRGD